MAFFERPTEEIVTSALSDLSTYSNITRLSPGAKARVLLDIVSKEQGRQYTTFDENFLQVFVKYADSRFLEFFGDMMNLPRREATHATIENDNFMFYIDSGDFGSINGGSDFVIPAGETISTSPSTGRIITPGIEAQPIVEYTTIEDTIAYANQSYVYVPIRAKIEGQNANVPRNVLTQHNFTGYLTSSSNTLKCINKYAIANGEERESVESYRFRLQNIFKARELAIPAAVRIVALSIPGVSNIKEVICEQGPGTYSLYVIGLTPTTSQSLLTEVSNAVSRVTGLGNRGFVLAPNPLGLEFVCAVNWSSEASNDDISRGYINMRNALEDRMNRTEMGQELKYSEIRDVILSASKYALSIGFDVPNKFESIYLYRQNPQTEGVVRNLVDGEKVIPLYNERVILETSGSHHGIRFISRQE